MPRSPAILCVFLAAVCLLAAGCGPADKTIHVWGTATFDGKPIPAGRVDFYPDVAQGNDGAQGFAIIRDGEFDTRKAGGQGHAGGPMVIKIEGFDGKSDDPRFPGTLIFKTYEINRDMPRESGELNLEVPASAAKDWTPPPKSPS